MQVWPTAIRTPALHSTADLLFIIAHSHSIYGRTWCSLGRKIDTITQDACAFHDDHVVYDSFNGVVLAEKEGKDIAKALGNKKAALLQNHGLLTTGRTVEEVSMGAIQALLHTDQFQAVFWFVSLEKCCHSQLMAEAAAASRGQTPIVIPQEEASYTYRTIGSPTAGWFSAKPLFDVIHKETAGDYLQ